MTIPVWPPTETAIEQAVEILMAGRLLGLPTETVYGLAGDACSDQAIQQIFAVKKRPPTSPLILHIAHPEQLLDCVSYVPDYVPALIEHYWPGPLTLVLPKSPQVSMRMTAGQSSVAVRMPAHPVARAVLQLFAERGSGWVAAPSANPFGCLSAVCPAQIVRYFASTAVGAVLDGGQSSGGIESTILSCLSAVPCVLRPGPLSATAIAAVIDCPVQYAKVSSSSLSVRVPGDVRHHYQPRIPLFYGPPATLASVCAGRGQGVWLGHHQPPDDLQIVQTYPLICDPQVYSHALFYICYEAEQSGADYIAMGPVPDTEAWRGVRDRLYRAASSWEEAAVHNP